MMTEMLKTTATVLGKHKLPTHSLGAIHDTMREQKAPIDQILGLTPENLFRAPISLERSEEDVRKDYPQTYAVVAHLLNEGIKEGALIDLSTLSLVKNTVMVKGQEGKISRLLSKQIKGREEILDHCMKELKIAKPEQFLPKLGDIVRSGRKLWISTNLLDFLTSSTNASYTSCYATTGCHFNGNLSYARDNMTVITFVTEEKVKAEMMEMYKLGRSWLYLPGEHDTIVQPKSYGAYYDFEREAARRFIEAKIAAAKGIPNKFLLQHGQSYANLTYDKPEDNNNNGNVGYFDNYAIEVSYPADRKYVLPPLHFASAACLECGQTTDYAIKGVCSEHDGKVKFTCSICGQRHEAGRIHTVEGEHYCRVCFEERFATCGHCGHSHKKEDIEVIKGHRYCKACKEKLFVSCACCGKFGRKDRMEEMKGIGLVCAKCSDKYLLCSICGDYHPADQVEYYKYIGRVCTKCLPKTAFQCDGCGEYHPKADKKKVDKQSFCPACVARSEGQHIELKAKPKYADLPEGWDDYIEEVG